MAKYPVSVDKDNKMYRAVVGNNGYNDINLIKTSKVYYTYKTYILSRHCE